ncbi:hypothetical protein PC129_g18487 [Phytophthora cactorum]|uniref:Reverse transcriptase Ty1/copia-type domain-containing protein n=1 Tax=Phytophthora cactorum TaxID=29920 RepID=A0A329SLG9_9STRA|nr:hypothetical protein Pcac1_g5408 [Phytophthora cactorum]KAG2806118.1 hypothetical protein PC112_g17978 [Phytophthora cactorum]KAG2821346.1 hypothetical protein PC111_g11061 [Phytophthora cactorum]KAG2884321.1 hypothetical protein PC114_g20153 [Phytophthora cactorum]KAG2891520.1 hypothetical protein PC115_g19169 [Phytophthora cactorum]
MQVIRHMARLIAKRFTRKDGSDFEESYPAVAYLNSIRAKLAKCAADGYEIEPCDIHTTFLYAKVNDDIYMGLIDALDGPLTLAAAEGEGDSVCLLLQNLYGLSKHLVCGATPSTSI